jgi:hypothetical protein
MKVTCAHKNKCIYTKYIAQGACALHAAYSQTVVLHAVADALPGMIMLWRKFQAITGAYVWHIVQKA